MKHPKYLLLGWKPRTPRKFQNMGRPPTDEQLIPGRLEPLASGNAKVVIAAACAAGCGVLLFEVPKINTRTRLDRTRERL